MSSADPPGAPATVLTTDGQPPPAQAQRPTGGTMLARLQAMPPLVTEWGDFKLWPAQITAIRNLDASLAQNKPRALIRPMDQKKSVPLDALLQAVSLGIVEPEVLSTVVVPSGQHQTLHARASSFGNR